jgi:hypothetical protein
VFYFFDWVTWIYCSIQWLLFLTLKIHHAIFLFWPIQLAASMLCA